MRGIWYDNGTVFADEGEPVVLAPDQRELLLQWGTLTEEQRQIVLATMKHFNE